MGLQDPVNPVVVPHALAFLASDRFFAAHGRLPGASRVHTSLVHGEISSAHFSNSSAQSLANNFGSSQERANKRQKSDEPEDEEGEEDEEVLIHDGAALGVIAKEMAQSLGVEDETLLEKVESAAQEL